MPSFTPPSRVRFARRLLALSVGVALATLAACGSDTTNGTGPMDVSGTYNLATIDGASLPDTIPGTGDSVVVVTDGLASLYPASSYAISVGGTENGHLEFVSDAGLYSVSGSTITFISSSFPGASYTGVATSSGITATVPGQIVGFDRVSFTLVFDKAP